MSAKELKPKLDPETCAVCGRRLLQGEVVNWYVAPDSSRRAVCELCVSRAERARWVRERDGEQMMPLRPARAARAGITKRVGRFFGSGGEDEFEMEQFDTAVEPADDQQSRRKVRAARRRGRDAPPPIATDEPRSVRAVPTGPTAKLVQGLALFNDSQFPRTIAGLSRSLGDPQVAVVNASDSSVEVYVGWDIVWYSYRIDLGDATEPVEQSGRGNDTAELSGVVKGWNALADDYGRLLLRESAPGTPAASEPTEPSGKTENGATTDSASPDERDASNADTAVSGHPHDDKPHDQDPRPDDPREHGSSDDPPNDSPPSDDPPRVYGGGA